MVVVDASVAFKWFSPGEDSFEQALSVLQDHKLNKNILISPYLLILELANAWATKTKIPLNMVKIYLSDLRDVQIQFENMSFPLIEEAITLSRKYAISVYDALYVALAKEKQCDLITADNKLVSQVNLPFVKSL